MQKHVNLVDLVKSFPTNIYLQDLASIQKRTSPVKFAHLVEKSGKGSISNLSTKVAGARAAVLRPRGRSAESHAEGARDHCDGDGVPFGKEDRGLEVRDAPLGGRSGPPAPGLLRRARAGPGG